MGCLLIIIEKFMTKTIHTLHEVGIFNKTLVNVRQV